MSTAVASAMIGAMSGSTWREARLMSADQVPPGMYQAPADLEDRLILPMVNECVAILREGVVVDEDLIDAGVIFGTGFAPFRGGPLRYARERGPAEVRQRLNELEVRYGARFKPDAGWHQFINGPL